MKKGYFTLAAILLLMLAGVFYYVDPATSDLYPTCLFHKFTGLQCPGCGSQRAIHAILNGRFSEAAHDNLLLVISLPFLLAYIGSTARGTLMAKGPGTPFQFNLTMRLIAGAAIIAFWVIRNIY